jgi:peptide/nickel transport system substrate-binding protein
MRMGKWSIWTAAIGLLAMLAGSAVAGDGSRPFVWVRAGDALTLDPHAVNEGTTHALNHHIYEPLIVRDHTGQLVAALAVAWRQANNPLVWTFDLRPGVTFHDGTPMTAQDVVFSIERARAPTSDLATRLKAVDKIEAVSPDRIRIATKVRDPLLPIQLTDIFIMNEAWSRANGATVPLDFAAGEQGHADTNANGTGPYKLVERRPGVATRLLRHAAYWGFAGKEPAEIEAPAAIDYRPVPDPVERLEALQSGAADFVQDVPADELARLRQMPGVKLRIGPENRVIFLGLSVQPAFNGRPNILADPRAREAIALTIDRLALQRGVMLGQSIPTAVLAPPGINGFPSALDQLPGRAPEKARALIAAAAADAPAAIDLDCPDNRYVNDAAICRAVATQLAAIGLEVTPRLRPKAEHFAHVRAGHSAFYLLGWGVPTFDSAYIFANLVHSRTANMGNWNGTFFANAELDRQIEALSELSENGRRQGMVDQIWRQLDVERIYVPLHVQTLIYAMRDGVDIAVDISNTPKLKNARTRPRPSQKGPAPR